MKNNTQTKLYRMALRLEVLVGVCILIAIAGSTLGLLLDLDLSQIVQNPESLQAYLTTAMTIIIGVEFVKMIFSYTIDTVIEVMLLAVARQMVMTHTSPIENLMTISAVALLFVVRKFLFVRQLDHVSRDSDCENLFPRPPFFKLRKAGREPSAEQRNKSACEHKQGKEEETTDATL